jgi:hypothetical protein
VGVRTGDTVVVRGITGSVRSPLLHTVKQQSTVASIAASWPEPIDGGLSLDATAGQTRLSIGCKLVSREYFDSLWVRHNATS